MVLSRLSSWEAIEDPELTVSKYLVYSVQLVGGLDKVPYSECGITSCVFQSSVTESHYSSGVPITKVGLKCLCVLCHWLESVNNLKNFLLLSANTVSVMSEFALVKLEFGEFVKLGLTPIVKNSPEELLLPSVPVEV